VRTQAPGSSCVDSIASHLRRPRRPHACGDLWRTAPTRRLSYSSVRPSSIKAGERRLHQYGLGEDAELSKPVTVDVAALLAPAALAVTSVKEVSLTNNQDRASLLRKRATNLEWSVEGGRATRPHAWRISEAQSTPAMASLGPLEIKTFVVTHH
jgi:hypothetical protein